MKIYTDLTSPQCYLAQTAICAHLEASGQPAEWHPVATPIYKPPPLGGAEETVSERHKRVRAEYGQRNLLRYAEWQGLELRRLTADANNLDRTQAAAALLSANAAGVAEAFLNRAFREYWGTKSPFGADQLNALLEEAGASDPLRTYLDQAAAALDSARELGIFDAPAFVVEDELFIGQQHLPLIGRIQREGLAAVIPPVKKS